MRVKQHYFYIVTVVLLATLLTLSIGSQAKFNIDNLSSIAMDEQEKNTRTGMETLLQVARESVMQHIKLHKTDISTEQGVNEIIEECIKPLNVESSSSDLILLQVKPNSKVIYQKKEITLPDKLLDNIQTGVDSKQGEVKVFEEPNDTNLYEWVGIPPGIAEFDNSHTKWVLVLVKDKSIVQESVNNLIKMQTAITYRLYTILSISCLVVITTVITIYYLVKHINKLSKR